MTELMCFSLPVRVYIEDTDAGGIVFYANYLKYFERARTELMRSIGYELRNGMKKNINYVVHSLELKYLHSARLDDLIQVHALIEKIGRTFIVFKQWATDENDLTLAEGMVKVACVNLDTAKPRVLPTELLEKLS